MALRNAHYSESVPDWIAYQNDPSNDIEAESEELEKIKASFNPVATRIDSKNRANHGQQHSPSLKLTTQRITKASKYTMDIPWKLRSSAHLNLRYRARSYHCSSSSIAVGGHLAIVMSRKCSSYGPLCRISTSA